MTRVELVKAFSRSRAAGNPAGVVISETALADRFMPDIARQVGFGATAFLWPLEDGSIQVRFFSPRAESALCVHALIAGMERWTDRKGTSGPLTFRAMKGSYTVTREADGVFMVELPPPQYGPTVTDISQVAGFLRVGADTIDNLPMQVVGTGKPKLLIPIKSLDALLGISPNEEAVVEFCRTIGAEGIFLFSRETINHDCAFHARHWNPLALASEDPICGNASGALAAYLDRNGIGGCTRFMVEMGISTKLPGEVIVEHVEGIRVGGFAVKFDEIEIF